MNLFSSNRIYCFPDVFFFIWNYNAITNQPTIHAAWCQYLSCEPSDSFKQTDGNAIRNGESFSADSNQQLLVPRHSSAIDSSPHFHLFSWATGFVFPACFIYTSRSGGNTTQHSFPFSPHLTILFYAPSPTAAMPLLDIAPNVNKGDWVRTIWIAHTQPPFLSRLSLKTTILLHRLYFRPYIAH